MSININTNMAAARASYQLSKNNAALQRASIVWQVEVALQNLQMMQEDLRSR
jgi:hypothetical protein